MDIVVLCGGLSPERNVSFSSATKITAALKSRGHRVAPIDMFLGLEGYEGEIERIFEAPPTLSMESVDECEPDLGEVRRSRKLQSASLFGEGVLDVCAMADVVFIAMHGTCGEDGKVQATLELMGIPFTGTGHLGSAVAMAKDLTKRLLMPAGILTPQWTVVDADNMNVNKIADETILPVVVKPDDSGSSIGIDIVYERDALVRALTEAAKHSKIILLEQFIDGREIQVGVLDDISLPSIEIITPVGFYDYKNKYQPGAAIEICPAEIPAELEKSLGETTLRIHKLLGLTSYSRTDYIVDERGDAYFLEINTLPGMTPLSLIPQEASAIGIDYETLCEKIVEIAIRERGRS